MLARPIPVPISYIKFYDDLFYFTQQLIKWGLKEGDFNDNTYVALNMYEQLLTLEVFYNEDKDSFIDDPLWESTLSLVIKFLKNLNPNSLNNSNYINEISFLL